MEKITVENANEIFKVFLEKNKKTKHGNNLILKSIADILDEYLRQNTSGRPKIPDGFSKIQAVIFKLEQLKGMRN